MADEQKILWAMTIEQACEIHELALSRGKKPGDNIQDEIVEIIKKYNIKPLGTTDKDIDMLAGDFREEGLKVVNLNEIKDKNEDKTI